MKKLRAKTLQKKGVDPVSKPTQRLDEESDRLYLQKRTRSR